MKKILLSSLIAAAAAVPAFAGVDNINYQAVIKVGNNVIADQNVAMKFELLNKYSEVVYSEEQTPKTNAAGLVSCQLGKDDALSTLEWGDLTLQVSVNFGAGYEVISNEAVSSVPTALYALRSADNDDLREAVEELMLESELNKETILGVNAEIVRLNGVTEDLENQMEEANKRSEDDYMDLKGSIYRIEQNLGALQSKQNEDLEALNENIDAFATMNETRLDKMQNQLDAADKATEQLTEQIDAFATMNEARLDKMQNQMDEADKAIEENYDDLKGSIMRNEQSISALQGKVNENFESYQEDWQSLTKFQEEISTDVNEFKDQYAEDWQSLTKFQEEISTDVNEFKAQYAEDWQSLTKFQEGISTDVNEFKADYQESFQKMVEFQEGITKTVDDQAKEISLLKDTVTTLMSPDGEGSLNEMFGMFGEQMVDMINEMIAPLNAKIAALEAEIEALKK